jgi:hypothetical protein
MKDKSRLNKSNADFAYNHLKRRAFKCEDACEQSRMAAPVPWSSGGRGWVGRALRGVAPLVNFLPSLSGLARLGAL